MRSQTGSASSLLPASGNLLLYPNSLFGHLAPLVILGLKELRKGGGIVRRWIDAVASEDLACIGFLQALDHRRIDLADDLVRNAPWPRECKPDLGSEIRKALFRNCWNIGIIGEPLGCRNSERPHLPTLDSAGSGRERCTGYGDVAAHEICHGLARTAIGKVLKLEACLLLELHERQIRQRPDRRRPVIEFAG